MQAFLLPSHGAVTFPRWPRMNSTFLGERWWPLHLHFSPRSGWLGRWCLCVSLPTSVWSRTTKFTQYESPSQRSLVWCSFTKQYVPPLPPFSPRHSIIVFFCWLFLHSTKYHLMCHRFAYFLFLSLKCQKESKIKTMLVKNWENFPTNTKVVWCWFKTL